MVENIWALSSLETGMTYTRVANQAASSGTSSRILTHGCQVGGISASSDVMRKAYGLAVNQAHIVLYLFPKSIPCQPQLASTSKMQQSFGFITSLELMLFSLAHGSNPSG